MKIRTIGVMISVFAIVQGCVEIFNFDVSQEQKALIVDGYISDVSYNNAAAYAMENRYFDISLRFSSGVRNSHDEPVLNANIQLVSDNNESWNYEEVPAARTENNGAWDAGLGLYRLNFEDFKAEANKKYRILIKLENGDQYESGFESVPEAQQMANIYFKEEEVIDYKRIAGDVKIRTLKGITFNATVPVMTGTSDFVNYKWDYTTTYGAIAWGLRPVDINYKCWITSPLFFKNRVIAKDRQGGSSHELFFLETNNQYIHEGFSVLFKQMVMSDNYFQFWQDLENQEKQEELFAPPPYNILTNMKAVGHEKPVYGYFGVVSENFHRWYFSKNDLSYNVVYPESLQRCGSPPGPECFDCRLIGRAIRSTITNTVPTWWQD